MMGDRFFVTLACQYCGRPNDVYYAPTCDVFDFTCDCGKKNFVTADFQAKRTEDVTREDVVSAFEMATSVNHSEAEVKRVAAEYMRSIGRGRAWKR